MLDPKLIRSKTKKVAENLAKRDNDFDLGVFLDLEESSRKIQTEIETLRSEKNKLSKQIGSSGLDETSKQQTIEKVNKINDSLKASESDFEKISQEVNLFLREKTKMTILRLEIGVNQKSLILSLKITQN